MDVKLKKVIEKIHEMRNNAEANARKFDDDWKFDEARNEMAKAIALLELHTEIELILNE